MNKLNRYYQNDFDSLSVIILQIKEKGRIV